MACYLMPIMRAPGAARRSPAAVAALAARRTKRQAATAELPANDAFLLINNPSVPQQTAQIKVLTRAVESLTRGVVGG